MNSDLLARLVERVEGRFYGKYRATVVDNADPENRGRLRLRIPAVLGNEVVSGWALPCAPYGGAADQGLFFIPENESSVWVEFEGGDPDYPVWVGTFWGKPGGTTEAPKPGDAQSPPTRKIIRTVSGSSIEIEDKEGDEVFIIQYNDGSKKNTVTMDKDGIQIEDANQNKITMDSSGVTIKSDQINIGEGASEPLVLGNQLKTALDNWINTVFMLHMHTGNLGAPTSPPLPGAPLLLDPALSQSNKVK